MPKEITFRGKTIDELMQMSYAEFAELCNARARRSLLRHALDQALETKIKQAR